MSRERRELTLADVRELLEEVGARLADRGVHVDLLVVGGAAMALGYDQRRVTVDVDVVPRGPMAVLFEVSGEVAVERDLPHDWLNVNATAWVPPLDPDWADEGQQVDGLTIVPASPQILLSMKMLADRERDVADLITLVRHLGIRDAAEVVAIFQEVYPDGPPAREPTEEELTISAQEIIDAAW